MNKKGFMMAELVVVASIIVISLSTLYISYNRLITSYRRVINYYDVGLLYKLGYQYQRLAANSLLESTLEQSESDKYVDLSEKLILETGEVVYLVYQTSNLEELKNEVEHETFKEYITYLQDAVEINEEHFLVGEKCNGDNKCLYSYMEVK